MMPRRRSREAVAAAGVFAALLAATLGGCRERPDSEHGAGASVPSSSVRSSSAKVGSVAAPLKPASSDAGALWNATPPPVPAAAPACRVIAATGVTRAEDGPVHTGALLAGEQWLELEAGASLSLKHVTSARELRIEGPALVRACRAGREQLLLARGRVVTTAGFGARPGAEVLIATPGGVLRYGDAELTLELGARSLSVNVRAGQASFQPGAEAPPSTIAAKQRRQFALADRSLPALVASCRSGAAHAAELAQRVVARGDSEPLAVRARDHVRARQRARAACTIAAAATGLVRDPAQRASSWSEVERLEATWQASPRAGE